MATLPWILIPGFLVPIYVLTHLLLFARLAKAAPAERRVPLASAA